ncbi:hypothetical protein BLOT_003461 [Blomia tropicalis]|nr:hypothetical protein BLOT_003461 [Blomia tropicalis]
MMNLNIFLICNVMDKLCVYSFQSVKTLKHLFCLSSGSNKFQELDDYDLSVLWMGRAASSCALYQHRKADAGVRTKFSCCLYLSAYVPIMTFHCQTSAILIY